VIDYQLILAVALGIAVLLGLILVVKLQAFLALLISSIVVGIASGMSFPDIISTMQEGMGGTLGYVALVVGLGAIFGAILEHSGGATVLAQSLIKRFGEKRAPTALTITGFFVAIPVFFDVGFIILVPLIYALQRKTGKSLLLYALPLLAGLAITHAFIPPTPGPVAVAEILGADLGWVILFGFIAGVPAAIVCGPILSKFIARKIHIEAPTVADLQEQPENLPSVTSILAIISLPILLIVAKTLLTSTTSNDSTILQIVSLLGHPFTALIIANLLAWYLLGIRRGFSRKQLQQISTKSLEPAGIIILLTGAGGVFKQILVNTGTGTMLAEYFAGAGVSVLFFSFAAAALIRILQGSATVAMITAAGITAPLLAPETDGIYNALLVIAIASGASIMSHVNDSGFWLVSKYLGMSEQQTFKSWTVMTTLLALVGMTVISILSYFV